MKNPNDLQKILQAVVSACQQAVVNQGEIATILLEELPNLDAGGKKVLQGIIDENQRLRSKLGEADRLVTILDSN